jgi:hypothetical protein
MMRVIHIPSDKIIEHWQAIRPFIVSALDKFDDYDKYPLDFILTELIIGNKDCFVIFDNHELKAVFILESYAYPSGLKGANIFLLSGSDMKCWASLLHDCVVAYAKIHHAQRIEFVTRDGIYKKFFHDGLKKTRSALSIKIE